MKALMFCIALGIASAPPAGASDAVKIAVSPTHSFAPSLMRIRVRVEPNTDNRMLRIIVDSDDFYRQTDVQLEGDRSAATTEMEVRNLPGGEYEVSAVVIGSSGKPRATALTRAFVIAAMSGGGMPPR